MKLLSAVAILLFASAAHAQGYPLTCKFEGGVGATWQTQPGAPHRLNVLKAIKRSEQPSSAGVYEGYCAWSDRGMRPDEPALIGHEMENRLSIFEMNYAGRSTLITAPSPWAASSAIRGKVMVLMVHTGKLPGVPDPVLIIENY